MISIISINSSSDTTINAKPLTASVVRIAEDSTPKVTNGQTTGVHNYNARNVIKVQNYCNKTVASIPSVPVINHNEQNDHSNHTKPGHGGPAHENVLGQSLSHDEFDVDEGFNEDSSSSITSGNASIVSGVSQAMRASPTSPTGSGPATPSAAPSPDFDDYQQKLALMTINGPNGSVRGKRNTVRSRIQNYKELIKLVVSHLICIFRLYFK